MRAVWATLRFLLSLAVLLAMGANLETAPDAERPGQSVQRTIWQHVFAGRACPSPTPAYGRLYYAPNSMGVIYCFEPAGTKDRTETTR